MYSGFRFIFLRGILALETEIREGKLPVLMWRANRWFSFSVAVCKRRQTPVGEPAPCPRLNGADLMVTLHVSMMGCIEAQQQVGALSSVPDTPSQRVQFILGTEEDEEHVPHDLFTQLDEICLKGDEDAEWKETAR